MSGGDEADYDSAESIIHDSDNAPIEKIAGIVHSKITRDWHDANGFFISIEAV